MEKKVKLNAEDLENVSGGEIYGKPVGDHFETWFRCPKCNQYETMIYVFHPGYVDKAIMESSSVNVQRVYDADILHSKEFRNYLVQKEIELITYSDLKG